MLAVERPAVQTNIGRVAVQVDEMLATVVTGFAQTLQFRQEELVGIPLVRLDMVGDGRRDDPTLAEAEGAQGMLAQLVSAQALPVRGFV
jgi:hypothetical protein